MSPMRLWIALIGFLALLPGVALADGYRGYYGGNYSYRPAPVTAPASQPRTYHYSLHGSRSGGYGFRTAGSSWDQTGFSVGSVGGINRPHRSSYEQYLRRLQQEARQPQRQQAYAIPRFEPCTGWWSRDIAACQRPTMRWEPWMALYDER